MRILVIADVHANWPALQAIQEPYDVCLCVGDLVEYGLEAAPCLRWARAHARTSVRGNHDHDLAQDVASNGTSGFAYLAAQTRQLTRPQLRPDDLHFLSGLPLTRYVSLDEQRFLLVHGSPRDPLEEYGPPEVAFWQGCLEDVEADLICVGHTHVPYTLRVGDKLVVNPGSVGFPRDGDPRASYAMITDGVVELKRVEYPVEESARVIEESALSDLAKDLLVQLLRSGGEEQLVAQLRDHMEY